MSLSATGRLQLVTESLYRYWRAAAYDSYDARGEWDWLRLMGVGLGVGLALLVVKYVVLVTLDAYLPYLAHQSEIPAVWLSGLVLIPLIGSVLFMAKWAEGEIRGEWRDEETQESGDR